jgi:hypothetical protein
MQTYSEDSYLSYFYYTGILRFMNFCYIEAHLFVLTLFLSLAKFTHKVMEILFLIHKFSNN